MLVLSRKLNEEIVIDGHIRVQILEIRGGRIKLGIVAPPDVNIRRGELSVSAPAGASARQRPGASDTEHGAVVPEFAREGFVVREPLGDYAMPQLACAG